MLRPTPDAATDSSYWNMVGTEWADGRDHLWRAHADAVNTALCRRWLPSGHIRRLLKTDAFDEAVGDGLWPLLATRANHVETVDRAWTVATQARARQQGMSVTVTDVRALPYADDSFDAVVSNSTLDHFEDVTDIERSLRELHRVLTPGGRLLLTLDNPAHPVVAVRNVLPLHLVQRAGLVPYYVGVTLDAASAGRLLERLGFRVVETTAVLHCPRVVAVPFARLINRLAPDSMWTRGLLRGLNAFEWLERLPTRQRTGHFVALLCEKTG